MGRSGKAHGGVRVDHAKQLPRLRRIEGQVRGLQQMIEGERDCVDVAHQIGAVVAALRRVRGDMMRDHLTACARAAVSGDLSEAERRRLSDEVGALLAKLDC
ncbi:MAG: metal-sensitive transcriptional regulator [Acidobacteria bacterium]|nr:metal-sensitive transcriptional regulator [Acidobacteriota bacterium]MCA1619934.1 metal-sensitive transcriptional regulator [Acidobacteriota bacterium]